MYERETYLYDQKTKRRICSSCKLKCHVGKKHKYKLVYVSSFKKENKKCECECNK